MKTIQRESKEYVWVVAAGFTAALAAISAKLFSSQWFAGAILIVVGVFFLTKSSIEKEENTD